MSSTADHAPALPAPPVEWGMKAIMLGGGILSALALTAIGSVLPQIEAALAHGPGDKLLVKQLIGIVGLAMVIGAPIGGYLADKVSARRVLLVASLVYALAGTTGLYFSSLPALLACRLILGIASATIQITSLTIINTQLPKGQRAKWMGAHISVAMIGTIIVHPLAGALGEFSWRWPFALYAVGLLLGVAAIFGMPERTKVKETAEPSSTSSGFGSWFPFRFLFLALIIGAITYLPMVYTPYLSRERGISSPAIISLVLMGDSIAGAVLAFFYGRARRRVSIFGAFLWCFACTGIGTTVAALATTFTGLVVGLMIFGLGVGWMVPNLMTALAAEVASHQQGRATGWVKAAHFVAAPSVVILVEPITRHFGQVGAMWTAATLSAVALCALAWARFTPGHRTARAAVPISGDVRTTS